MPRGQEESMPKDDLKALIGRAGLDNLTRDRRNHDGNHPEHERMVDMLRRRGAVLISSLTGFTYFHEGIACQTCPSIKGYLVMLYLGYKK